MFTETVDNKPKIITICSSMRFKEEIELAEKMLTLKGWLVFKPAPFYPEDIPDVPMTPECKERFMKMHFEKIKLSNAIYVVNKDRYIGESTKEEMEYARSLGKWIYYYEGFKM